MSRAMSLGQLARAIGRDKGHLSRVETGRGRHVTPALVRDYERTLAVTIAATVTPDPSGPAGASVDDVRRRQVLGGIAALAASVGAAGLNEVIADERGADRLYGLDIDALRAPTLSYRRMEQRLPSRSVVAPVTAHLGLLRQLAARNPTARDLSAVLSEAAGLAAWLYADLDERDTARRHYRLSIKAAERSGHPLLAPYMQASLGHYLALTGEPAGAMRLVAAARKQLTTTAHAIATVWMDAVEAVVLAVGGDTGATTSLSRAESRLSTLDSEEPVWPWVFRFDNPKLAAYRAVAAARLGRTGDAIAALADAGQGQVAPKQRAVLDVERARVLAKAGRVDEACSVAVRAFDDARRYGSDRVLNAVAAFRTQLGVRGAVTSDLDERLDSLHRTSR